MCWQLEPGDDGCVHFRGENGKFWHLHDGGIFSDADCPQDFFLELRGQTAVCVKTGDGLYVNSERNGAVRVVQVEPDMATVWEF